MTSKKILEIVFLFLLALHFVACQDFTITAALWEANAIIETITPSAGVLDIANAVAGHDGTSIYLFGGESFSGGTDYANVHIFNASTNKLSAEFWTADGGAPVTTSSVIVYPNQYTQGMTSSNSFYCMAFAYHPSAISLFNGRFFADLTTNSVLMSDPSNPAPFVSNNWIEGSNTWCTYAYNGKLYLSGFMWGQNNYAYIDLQSMSAMLIEGTVGGGQPDIARHTCVLYEQTGQVYTFGGRSSLAVNSPAYKCAADYSSCGAMADSSRTHWHRQYSVVVDELIFVIGGWFSENGGEYKQDILVWDPAQDDWSSRSSQGMAVPRKSFHAQWLPALKKLVFVGGGNGETNAVADDISVYTYTMRPTAVPTAYPSSHPSSDPSADPTTASPSNQPSTDSPSILGVTDDPSMNPTTLPSLYPSSDPTANPVTEQPTFSNNPTRNPSVYPTGVPSADPISAGPTSYPTSQPSGSRGQASVDDGQGDDNDDQGQNSKSGQAQAMGSGLSGSPIPGLSQNDFTMVVSIMAILVGLLCIAVVFYIYIRRRKRKQEYEDYQHDKSGQFRTDGNARHMQMMPSRSFAGDVIDGATATTIHDSNNNDIGIHNDANDDGNNDTGDIVLPAVISAPNVDGMTAGNDMADECATPHSDEVSMDVKHHETNHFQYKNDEPHDNRHSGEVVNVNDDEDIPIAPKSPTSEQEIQRNARLMQKRDADYYNTPGN